MPSVHKTQYERRVELALKWAYLDNLDYDEIQERFIEEGYGEFAISTIRKYVNQSEASEEVVEKIRESHANTRIQIAERQEELFKKARSSEMQATEDEPIKGLVPVEDKVDGRLNNPKSIPYNWEVVRPGDELPPSAPEGADPERDTIIRIDNSGSTTMKPGDTYPKRDWKGEPVYTTEIVGIRRESPDRTQRSFLRQEQQSHLQAKGEAMGIYEDTINLQGNIGLDAEVTIPEELIEAVVGASHNRLSSDSGGDGDDT